MNRYKIYTTATLALASIAMATAMPQNSYLLNTVDSIPEMITQIKKNPVVSDRYERHFHMTQAEVIEYIRDLHLTKTNSDAIFSVYNVPAKTGELRSKLLHLKKGTKIWVNAAGQPILQWICGNPMTRGPQHVAVTDEYSATVAGTDTGLTAMAEPMPTADVPVYAMNATPTVPTPEPEEIISVIDQVPVTRKSNWAAALLLLPLGFIATHHDNNHDCEPVPEPTSILIMGVGVTAMVARRRKNR